MNAYTEGKIGEISDLAGTECFSIDLKNATKTSYKLYVMQPCVITPNNYWAETEGEFCKEK